MSWSEGVARPLRRLGTGRTGDGLLAGGALLVLVASALLLPGPAPLPLALVVAVLSALPLAWRRVAPLPVLLLGVCPVAVESLLAGARTSNTGQFVVLLVLLFSFGVYAGRAELPAGLLIAVVAVYVVQASDATSSPSELVVTPPTLVLLPFLAGRLLRRQTATSRRLHTLALELDRRREEDAQAATLAERARIAREVHDVVAHSVGVMVVQAGAAEELAAIDPGAAADAMAAVRSTGRDALAELRRLLGLLVTDADEAVPAPQPGLDQLQTLLHQVREAGLPVAVTCSGAGPPLQAGVDLAAYRIVQEALTNVRKHGGASAELRLARSADGISLDVRDPGRPPADSADGEDPPGGRTGHGLLGMRERVGLYEGTLAAGPSPSGGWQVSAWLPARPG